MKIFIAAPFDRAGFGTVCQNGFTQLGHKVTIFNYRREARHSNRVKRLLSRFTISGVERMNRALIREVEKSGAELLLVIKGEIIFPETLMKIKHRAHTRLAVWHGDNPFSVLCSTSQLVHSLPVYDYVFIFDPYYIPALRQFRVARPEYLTVCSTIDPKEELRLTPEEIKKFQTNVAFVGNAGSYGAWRRDLLNHISDQGLKIWGRFWKPEDARGDVAGYWGDEPMPALARCNIGVVDGMDILKAYHAAKMGVNVLSEQSVEGLNMRSFEIPASGTLCLTNDLPMLGRHFKIGEEVVTYRDEKDLRTKVDYYLAHPDETQAIAANGRRRYNHDHTAAHRMKELLSHVS